jgi:hypothetical protein
MESQEFNMDHRVSWRASSAAMVITTYPLHAPDAERAVGSNEAPNLSQGKQAIRLLTEETTHLNKEQGGSHITPNIVIWCAKAATRSPGFKEDKTGRGIKETRAVCRSRAEGEKTRETKTEQERERETHTDRERGRETDTERERASPALHGAPEHVSRDIIPPDHHEQVSVPRVSVCAPKLMMMMMMITSESLVENWRHSTLS